MCNMEYVYIEIMYSLLRDMLFGCMNVLGYLQEFPLLLKELLCNSSLLFILELRSVLTLVYTMCTFGLLWNFKHLDLNIS
jgi:hypothetical protein